MLGNVLITSSINESSSGIMAFSFDCPRNKKALRDAEARGRMPVAILAARSAGVVRPYLVLVTPGKAVWVVRYYVLIISCFFLENPIANLLIRSFPHLVLYLEEKRMLGSPLSHKSKKLLCTIHNDFYRSLYFFLCVEST